MAPTGFDEIQRRSLSYLFGQLVFARLIASPVLAAVAVWIALIDRARWRQATMVTTAVALVAVSAYELLRFRRQGVGPRSFVANLVANALGHAAMMVATGGLDSPLMPALTLIGLFSAVLAAPGRFSSAFVAMQGVVVLVLAYTQSHGLGPRLPDVLASDHAAPLNTTLLWTRAGALVVILAGTYQIGRRLRRAVDTMLSDTLAARDDALQAHVEQAQTLTVLTAEIAHELKNPLASVKGLAVLVGRGLTGRAAEHVTVLRREVDRMQGILEEFLNFSRPLVPLTQEPCDLGELCDEVATLHDGVAFEKRATVVVRASGPAAAVCDRRKVKQVLINLVQNALDAGPAGGTVALVVSADATLARVRVEDDGPGPPDALGSRVFDAGVTTKPRGSGLGLTVARALARQHGGDVVLRARADAAGGVAELTLPVGGTVAPADGGAS